MAVKIRSEKELNLMRKSGEISAAALKKVIESAREGVTLIELDKLAEQEITRLGGESSFKTEPGYKWATCLTVNEEVVHGIPRDIKLKTGDILGIDVGAIYKGWHTDTAWSIVVDKEQNQFLKVGEQALWEGIEQAREGNRIGDIAAAIQSRVEGSGYSIVRSLIGHGVGEKLHEEPEVPGYGTKGTGLMLKAGMTLAVEVIYTAGNGKVELAKDGWTFVSIDGSTAGLFEMSIIVGKERAEVLTYP